MESIYGEMLQVKSSVNCEEKLRRECREVAWEECSKRPVSTCQVSQVRMVHLPFTPCCEDDTG